MAISIRTMTTDDMGLVFRLKSDAGWNQTRVDIERFLFLEPSGAFVGEWNGVPMATGVSFAFEKVGWIAMILVAPEMRGRGLGTAITTAALEYLVSCGITTVRLDATALGQPVYEKLGFTVDYRLARFHGVAPSGPTTSGSKPLRTAPLGEDDFDTVAKLDHRITATRRTRLLRRLNEESPGTMRVVHEAGAIAGYMTSRKGENAAQIGPGVAVSPAAGIALLDAVTARRAGAPIYIDIPYDNPDAQTWATEHGLIVQRDLVRMTRGIRIADHPESIWASSSPEKG